MLKEFTLGAAAVIATGLARAYLFIATGGMPANADAKPSALEEWAARKSLHVTIGRQAPTGSPPVAAAGANLAAGGTIYYVLMALLARTIHEARRETSKMPADTRSAPPGRRRHTHTVCRGGRVSATQ